MPHKPSHLPLNKTRHQLGKLKKNQVPVIGMTQLAATIKLRTRTVNGGVVGQTIGRASQMVITRTQIQCRVTTLVRRTAQEI